MDWLKIEHMVTIVAFAFISISFLILMVITKDKDTVWMFLGLSWVSGLLAFGVYQMPTR